MTTAGTSTADKPADRQGQQAAARRQGLSVGIPVGFSGVAFGAAAHSAGLTLWQTAALSLIAFTGASQFALIGVVAAGGNLLAGAAGAILLGGRNALYGLRLAGLLRLPARWRVLAAQGVIDETTAVSTAQPTRAAARTGFAVTLITLYLMWNATTVAGALAAGALGNPQRYGLDVVGPAAFLALMWPRLIAGRREQLVAAVGAVIALAATPLFPPGVPVMIAAIAALAGAVRR